MARETTSSLNILMIVVLVVVLLVLGFLLYRGTYGTGSSDTNVPGNINLNVNLPLNQGSLPSGGNSNNNAS